MRSGGGLDWAPQIATRCGTIARRGEDGLRYGAVIFGTTCPAGVTPAQEEASPIGPASGVERVCNVFADRGNLATGKQRTS